MEYFIAWFGLCVVVWVFANTRGRLGFGWFCLALLVSPLVAGLLVLVLPSKVPPPPCHRQRIEPYLTVAALSLMLGLAHQAVAAEDWFVAAPRFHACDAVASHFTGLHTPEQVQALYQRLGTRLNLDRISPVTVMLIDPLDDHVRMVFFADRGICEADLTARSR